MQQAAIATEHRFLLYRNPHIRRIALQRFAKKASGRDAGHGYGMTFNDESGPN